MLGTRGRGIRWSMDVTEVIPRSQARDYVVRNGKCCILALFLASKRRSNVLWHCQKQHLMQCYRKVIMIRVWNVLTV